MPESLATGHNPPWPDLQQLNNNCGRDVGMDQGKDNRRNDRFDNKMAGGVRELEGVVVDVGVAVEGLGIGGAWNDGVGLNEPA